MFLSGFGYTFIKNVSENFEDVFFETVALTLFEEKPCDFLDSFNWDEINYVFLNVLFTYLSL